MKQLALFLLAILVVGCSTRDKGIQTGTFEIYENDSLVGRVYRFGNYQIEKYPDGNELIARIDFETDSTYFLKGVEENPNEIESIIWLNKYKEVGKNRFEITATPSNSNVDYRYEGVLLKVYEEIDKTILKRLDSLNQY